MCSGLQAQGGVEADSDADSDDGNAAYGLFSSFHQFAIAYSCVSYRLAHFDDDDDEDGTETGEEATCVPTPACICPSRLTPSPRPCHATSHLLPFCAARKYPSGAGGDADEDGDDGDDDDDECAPLPMCSRVPRSLVVCLTAPTRLDSDEDGDGAAPLDVGDGKVLHWRIKTSFLEAKVSVQCLVSSACPSLPFL